MTPETMGDASQMLKEVSQDMFPGSTIEPRWAKPELIERAPFYAMRVALGGQIVDAPRGRQDFVAIVFEGQEYILEKQNYKAVRELIDGFDSFLIRRGYVYNDVTTKNIQALRYNPNLILDGLAYLQARSNKMLDIPADKTRLFWCLADQSACTLYRSLMPGNYIRASKPDFFSEQALNFSHNTLSYYDAIFYHRAPGGQVLSILQTLKLEKKVLVYEVDDDLFNLPDWNPSYETFNKPTVQALIRQAMGLSDIILTTTNHLAGLLRKVSGSKVVMVAPNLIDTASYIRKFQGREVDEKLRGVFVRFGENDIKYTHYPSGEVQLTDPKMVMEINPVRILWTGSATHERDLDEAVPAIIRICNEYGLSVNFIFQNYLPIQLSQHIIPEGQAKPVMTVAKEFHSSVTYSPGCPPSLYPKKLASFEADFAICPLHAHEFNLSKSSIKPLEMAASGLASIVTDYGPYEFIEDGMNGLKVKPGDAEGWYTALKTMIEDVTLRRKLADNAFETCLYEHSWALDNDNRKKWDAALESINKLVMSRNLRNR